MASSIDIAVVPNSVPSTWSRESNKAFETALAEHAHEIGTPDGWKNIGAKLCGMYSHEELSGCWYILNQDVNSIEAGGIALPDYVEPTFYASSDGDSPCDKKDAHVRSGNGHGASPGVNGGAGNAGSGKGSSTKSTDTERRKGVAWSEEEHRLFLLGLDKFGKGDWRSISRNFVTTRTPTQVASHAQKYYIRMNSMSNKEKRRSSIHDITSVSDGSDFPGPITGLASSSSIQRSSSNLHADGGLYGTGQMGISRDHPMAGQVLMAPVGHPHHMQYGPLPVMQAPSVPMQHMATVYPRSQCANA